MRRVIFSKPSELELELVQSHMAQKPVLRVDPAGRVRRANLARVSSARLRMLTDAALHARRASPVIVFR